MFNICIVALYTLMYAIKNINTLIHFLKILLIFEDLLYLSYEVLILALWLANIKSNRTQQPLVNHKCAQKRCLIYMLISDEINYPSGADTLAVWRF